MWSFNFSLFHFPCLAGLVCSISLTHPPTGSADAPCQPRQRRAYPLGFNQERTHGEGKPVSTRGRRLIRTWVGRDKMRIWQYNTTHTCGCGVALPASLALLVRTPSSLAATRARHRVASAPVRARGRGAKSPFPGNLGGWWFFTPLEPPVRRIQTGLYLRSVQE